MASKRRVADYRIAPFDLHLVIAVMEHGTITRAAAEVSLSLPAASARLKALELAMGVRLFERSKAGVMPTEAGRALTRHARRVLADLECMHVDMVSFGIGLRGTVRLLCNTAAMSECLPPKLTRFLVEHPDLDVDVQEMSSDAVLDGLHRGVADLGIVADYVDPSGLITWPWKEDELVALVPRKWMAGSKRTTGFADLLDHPFVGLSREGGLSQFLARQARLGGRALHHRVRLSSFDAVARMVDAGVGVAVMPRSAGLRFKGATSKLLPLLDTWAKRRLLVCVNGEAQGAPGVQALIRALLEG